MFFRSKFWLAVAALTVCASPGFSLEDHSEEDHSEYVSLYRKTSKDSNVKGSKDKGSKDKGSKDKGSKHKGSKVKEQPSFKIFEPINPAFYLAFGGTIGESLSHKRTSAQFTNRGVLLDTQTDDSKQTSPAIGFLGIAGYQLNEIVSFEVYYAESAWDLKRTDTTTFLTDNLGESTRSKRESKQLDFGPRTILALPIHKYFAPYFMAGLSAEYYREKQSYDGSFGPNQPVTSTQVLTTWKLFYGQGYGVRSQITKNFGLRLEIYTLFFTGATTRANFITYVSF